MGIELQKSTEKSVESEESTNGLGALAVPLKSRKGAHLAALAVSFPAKTLGKKEQAILARKISAGAKKIENLGLDDWDDA